MTPAHVALALVAIVAAGGLIWYVWRRESRVRALVAEVARLGDIAAERQRRLEELRAELNRRAREADSLLEIALATGSTLDEQELLEHIARGAARACRADRCSVYLLDESGGWVTPAMIQPAEGAVDPETWAAFASAGKLRLPALPYIQEAVVQRAPVVIADAAVDIRVPRSRAERFGLRSLFAIPLVRLGRVVGVLVFEYGDGSSPISPDQVQLGVLLAEQVALAMQNAGLYADAETRRREAEVMAEVVGAINGSLELDTVLQRIAEGARDLCRSDIAALALRDPGSHSMLLRYHTGTREGSRDAAGPARKLLGTDGRGEARRIGEEYVAVMREEGLVAVAVVSIRSEQSVEGLLYVGNHSPRPFTPRDRAILAKLAEHAAIAIKNGRLFESARVRLARMTRLTALAQLTVSSVDSQRVHAFVTRAAVDLLGADAARLWILDEDAGSLRLAASEEREASAQAPAVGAEVPVGLQVLASVLERRLGPRVGESGRGSRPGLERALSAGYAAQLTVPLVAGERARGALVVMTRAPRAFGAEDEELLELLASQAAAALEHARLSQRVQEAYADLAETQEQLTHAQKMEAIGRLAGGVAHDFNNLLTVIRGRAEQMLDRLPAEHPLHRHADLIHRTGDRAAALAQQLLTFSRRQLAQPQVLDLNEVVREMEPILRRVMGESIRLQVLGDPALGRVRADATQLQQVVMNLSVNARDAMPHGGTLTIRTANTIRPDCRPAAAGHVLLEVRDTGIGMDERTRQRIFEPFFTTKQPGKGTGLGLATVLAIVEQTGGQIDVDSAPGAGTTFRILLPRIEVAGDAAVPPPVPAPAGDGHETLLVLDVAGDLAIRPAEVLRAEGYEVLAAASGEEAIQLADRRDGPIHLLITPLSMPEMSGPEVAARILAGRPDLAVLYVASGPEDGVDHQQGLLEAGEAFLPGPCTAGALIRRVRELLDAAGLGTACVAALRRDHG